MKRIVRSGLLLITVVTAVADAQTAKSAILFIGDGMGPAQVTAGRIYQKNARDGQLNLDSLPYTAIVRTYSADRMVTDSAAAATALAAGVKTKNLVISQDVDGNTVETILEKAKAAGKSVGVVTTTTVTHATPACFYAHASSRASEDALAEQLINYGKVDVVMGGGREFFLPQTAKDPENGGDGKRRDGVDLIAKAQEAGYRVIMKQEEFDALSKEVASGADPGKVMCLFSPGMMSYEVDRKNDAWGEPPLSETTRVAIDLLKRNPNGFFLMVEGGRIDHGSHGNSALQTVTEMVEFDNAVGVGVKNAPPDTLIVATADHETGGLAINGYAPIDVGGDALLTQGAGGVVADILTYATGPGGDRSKYEGKDKATTEYRNPAVFTVNSAAHSGVDVHAWASGPGGEEFHGTLDNTDIAKKIMAALGLN